MARAGLATRLARWVRRSKRVAPDRGRRGEATSYPGDFIGVPELLYQPNPDGLPDPGEIVWTWVPFEEDPGQGKDRPVLVVGRDGSWLLGLMLTSRDHDLDAAQEARHGRRWVDIGSGAWDPRGRASEVRVDRILRLDPAGVRREGATVSPAVFDMVVAAVRAAR
jgi:PemK-like, MazF-like toxin of type II toxin-antitoxin system